MENVSMSYTTPKTTAYAHSIEEQDLNDAAKILEEQMAKAAKEESVDGFDKEVKEEKPKKKPLDINKMALVALASIAGGAVAMKFMPIARRLSAKVLGSVAEKVVEFAGKLGQKFPKLSFNSEKVINSIRSVKTELIEGNSTKLFENVKKHLQEILGIEIKTKSPVLAGIKNDVGFIDAIGASVIGYQTTGKAAAQGDKEVTKNDLANAAGNIILISG